LTGDLDLTGGLTMTGDLGLTGVLDVSKETHLRHDLVVDGSTILGGGLVVAGNTFTDNLDVVGNTNTDNLVVNVDSSMQGALMLQGPATFRNTLMVGGDSFPDPIIYPDHRLNVNGNVGAKKYCNDAGTNCYPITDLSLWKKNGSDIYYNGGHVGIGTNGPNALLNIKDNNNIINGIGTLTGGQNLTGNGTVFTSQLKIGDTVISEGKTAKVTRITSDTDMGVAPALMVNNKPFTIKKALMRIENNSGVSQLMLNDEELRVAGALSVGSIYTDRVTVDTLGIGVYGGGSIYTSGDVCAGSNCLNTIGNLSKPVAVKIIFNNYSLTGSDYYIIPRGSGNIRITLPKASLFTNKIYTIKPTQYTSASEISVRATPPDFINTSGTAGFGFTYQDFNIGSSPIILISDGTSWFSISLPHDGYTSVYLY
jgi:hypothetical protein